MNEKSLREAIRDTMWRQGIVVEDRQKIAVISHVNEYYPWIANADALVLFSQDCDLLNPSLENEPFAEFFCVTYIPDVNPSLAYGKNPREIHMRINDSQCIRLLINHRIRIDRALLVGMSPEHQPLRIPNGNLKMLLSWLSKKYSRPAFPDRFNELLAQIPKLDKKLLDLNASFTTIKRFFFLLEPNTEIGANQRYLLSIKVLLDGRFSIGDEKNKKSISERLRNIFSMKQIRISDISCDFEDELTIFEMKNYVRWDKDYISRRCDFVL